MNPVVLPQPLPSEVVVFLEDRMRLLGHSTRIRTLDELRGGERNVQSIADAMMTTQQNVSGHLRLLRSAGAVSRRPAGREVLYALRDTSILDVWRQLLAGIQTSADGSLTEPVPDEPVFDEAHDVPQARR